MNPHEYNPFPDDPLVESLFNHCEFDDADAGQMQELKEAIIRHIDDIQENAGAFECFDGVVHPLTLYPADWVFILTKSCWSAIEILGEVDDDETSLMNALMTFSPEFMAFKIRQGDKYAKEWVNDAFKLGKTAKKIKDLVKEA